MLPLLPCAICGPAHQCVLLMNFQLDRVRQHKHRCLTCTLLCWTFAVAVEHRNNARWSIFKRFPHMSIILVMYWATLLFICRSLSLSRSLSGCLENYPASSSIIRNATLVFERGLLFIIYVSPPAVSCPPSLSFNLIDPILYFVWGL